MKWVYKIVLSALLATLVSGQEVLVEAESFADRGGWKLDTQFIEIMGSPYLIAHGLGAPVADAKTDVTFARRGTYRVWVRTKDWVARWKAPGAPGTFQVLIDGKALEPTFGATGADWHWQDGGTVKIEAGKHPLALRDLTGFDGRCDAILFSATPGFVPDNTSDILPAWRREMLGFPADPVDMGPYDLVVVGGGYAGTCAAISGARMGIKVALIQNRGVLGGNGSSEVRVWAMGNTPGGLYPVGDIVNELSDHAKKSPGTYEEFEDAKKEKIVLAESNVDLFLNHHAYAVDASPKKIKAVYAFDVTTGEAKKFRGTFYSDCTGHGYIAMKAGADSKMIPNGRMGMSNMWSWEDTDAPQTFPETPWALELDEAGFPYPRDHHAQWFWESGYDKHPLNDLEAIRDWNLRASYGAWSAIKNNGAYARNDKTGSQHKNARLTWLAYVGGTRETQQFMGDIELTEPMILEKKAFPDAAVLSTWSIDLHYPKEQYIGKYADNPFISKAVHGKGVDRSVGYPVPYRCFYSRNIDNLFLAGRNVSVTHKALGTVRVMKTCGMMGVVVGKAASICAKYDCSPRDVYETYLNELIDLMKLPGGSRRATVIADMIVGESVANPDVASAASVALDAIKGIVVDNRKAKLEGDWFASKHTPGYVGKDYIHDEQKNKGKMSATFPITIPKTGVYELRISYRGGGGRATHIPITIQHGASTSKAWLDQSVSGNKPHGFAVVGEYFFTAGKPASVKISNEGTIGFVIVDAIQLIAL